MFMTMLMMAIASFKNHARQVVTITFVKWYMLKTPKNAPYYMDMYKY